MTPCVVCAAPCAGPRCARHEAERQAARNADRAGRYGPEHQAARRRWLPKVRLGNVRCRWCRRIIRPSDDWDLGHRDRLPSHPEHARCNRSHPNHATPVNDHAGA